MLYFAYGSNMDPEQMRARCPGARFVAIGSLADHALCFPRYSVLRACGVASVIAKPGEHTWGVVYQMTLKDFDALDAFEDYRENRAAELNSYNRVTLDIEMQGVPTAVSIYFAVHQESSYAPNAAYLRHIHEGARHFGLPEPYIRSLESIDCTQERHHR